MSPQSKQESHTQWLQRIHNALVRSRKRAKETARQTGTPLVYEHDGKIVHEFFDATPRGT